jgi:hypothetical protein
LFALEKLANTKQNLAFGILNIQPALPTLFVCLVKVIMMVSMHMILENQLLAF